MSAIHPDRLAKIKTHHSKPQGKSSSSSKTVIDNGAFEKLETILKPESNDITPVLVLLSKGLGVQLIQIWSYYSHVNDHSKFTNCTVSLTRLLKRLSTVTATSSKNQDEGEDDEEAEFDNTASELSVQSIQAGVEIIKEILINHTKVIYRGLSSLRASLVNPVLRLLNEFIVLGNGSLIDDFFSLFDFQLAVLPKLLNPTKTELSNVENTKTKEHLSIRYCFIRFLLNLLKFSNVIVRKDFISGNVKLFSAWVKHIAVIDSDALIKLTLAQWGDFILASDSGVSKSLKIKVFNEWNIIKLIPIFHSKDKDLRSEFNQFLLRLFIDSKTGISFPSEESWFSSAPSTSSMSGSGVSVNGKHFKCNNKIIYSALTNLKPWDDDLQSQLTITILQSHSELIAPYMNYLASRGLHDPKLTNYWLGQTLLISKIIKLPLSADVVREKAKPSAVSVLKELTVPCVLNRGVLTKCFTSEVGLIRQLSNQLVLDSLMKLNHIVHFLMERNQIDLKVELIQLVYSSLPDLSSVCTALNENYTKFPNSRILLLTNLMIIEKYSKLFNDNFNYSTVISKPYMDLISKNNNSVIESESDSEFSNIDLVLLDQFFKLQKDQTSQFKWWMKNNATHTLFTSLLQITSNASGSGISSKIEELLETLASQTVIFNYSGYNSQQMGLKSSPIFPLLHSLKVISSYGFSNSSSAAATIVASLVSIYNVIDETISRAVKTPFKYLDQSNEVGKVSVFIVALLEQWKFISCENPDSLEWAQCWLGLYLRYAIISGESFSGVVMLLDSVEQKEIIKSWMIADVTNANQPVFQQSLSYCDLVTITPLDQLHVELSTGVLNRPTSDFDIMALLSRIEQIIVTGDGSATLSSLQEILSLLMTQFGEFLASYPVEIIGKFYQARFWKKLFLDSLGKVGCFVSQLLSDVFEQLDLFNVAEFSAVVLEKLTIFEEVSEDDVALVLARSLWCLPTEELRNKALSHTNKIIQIGALRVMLDRKLTLSSDELVQFLSNNFKSENLLLVLKEFVKADLIIFGDFEELFEALATDYVFSKDILKELLNAEQHILTQLIYFVMAKNDLSLSTFIWANLSPSQYRSLPESELLVKLTNAITVHALSLLKINDFSEFNSAQLCNILTISASSTSNSLSAEDKQYVLDFYLATEQYKYSSHVTSLLIAIGLTATSLELVKTWVNKSILYLTKIFAEFTIIPDSTLAFLSSLEQLFQISYSVVGLMNKMNINALLEVIYSKWCHYQPALAFSTCLLCCVEAKKVKIDGKKLLQILINNDSICLMKSSDNDRLNFLTVINISKLFNLDSAANSTISIRDRLLLFYTATTSASDLILLQILETIEAKTGSSWIDSVFSWDLVEGFTEEDEDLVGAVRFIEKKKEGLIITLNKRYITNGLTNYQIDKPQLPKIKANWIELEQFFTNALSLKKGNVVYYDPLILTLLIINNDELVKVTTSADTDSTDVSSDLMTTKINVKKLIDFDLLQSLVLNLSSNDETLLKITFKILSAVQVSLNYATASADAPDEAKLKNSTTSSSEVSFKDALFVKLYLTKILYTFHKTPTTPRTPLTIHLISQLLPILKNPAHDLYEKAYRWVIKSPQLHANDIPLYVDITSFNSKDTVETNDVYYKNISWLLTNVKIGLRGLADLRLLQNRGFIEWMFNLMNNPYVTIKVKYQILELISQLTELEQGAGVSALVTRYAGLLNLEQEMGKAKDVHATTLANNEVKRLQNEQYLINLKELAVKYGIVASSETTAGKRIRDWTEGEVERVIKRVVNGA